MARRDGKPIAILQGTVRSQYRVRKLLCGSTSGTGVAWLPGEDDAARGCFEAACKATRPAIAQVFSTGPVDLDGIEWLPSNTFQLRLDRPFASIVATMEKRARHAARRAERLGVKVEQGTDPHTMDQAYEVIESAARERKFPVPPRSYSLALHRAFDSAGAQRCFVARVDGHVVSSVSVLGYGTKVAWWKGGSLREGYRRSAGNALQLAAIHWAKDRGFRIYDFGGTDPRDPTYSGIHRFKASFGGTPVESSVGTRTTALARHALKVRKALRAGWHDAIV